MPRGNFMSDPALVSVVIPTFNREQSLVRAAKSVINQSYRQIELIIADDGSDDNSAKAIEKLADDRVTFLPLSHTGHPGKVRNHGIQNAKGDFIAFLDSDDQWHPHKIEKQVKTLADNPNIVLSWTNALIHRQEINEEEPLFKEGAFTLHKDPVVTLLRGNSIITSTTMIRKSVLTDSGIFNETPEFRIRQDYEFWMRIASCGAIHYDPEPMATYFWAPDSIGRVNEFEDLKSRLRVMQSFSKWTKNVYHRLLAKGVVQFTRCQMLLARSRTNRTKG